MQSAILPKVVQEKFSQFFDETPQAGWKEVEKVLKEEYGHKFPGMTGSQIVDQIFMPGSFEKRAVGSASIAQVHKARLPNGDEVAVKIQKPWIQRQVGLDLFCFKAVTYCKFTKGSKGSKGSKGLKFFRAFLKPALRRLKLVITHS